MRAEWLQVPEEMIRVRSVTLSRLLTVATGKRVSQGDALMLVCRLWSWVITQVSEDADDLEAEFKRCSVLPKSKADLILPDALGWPEKHICALLDALADPLVQVLTDHGDTFEVAGIEKRYTRLAKQQGAGRGRARASYLAKEHGWKHQPGVGYVSPQGEVITDWRELIERLGR